MARIVVVEDDPSHRRELIELLQAHGYEIRIPEDFLHVPQAIDDCDLVLLDLGLPGIDGIRICRDIRESSNIPIIVLTSRTSEVDEVMSMSLGADDFIAKPYSPHVLTLRIEALLRRSMSSAAASHVLSHEGVSFDSLQGTISYQDKKIEVGKNEQKILRALLRKPGELITRSALMRELWDSDCFIDDNTLSVNIARLRASLQKLGVADEWLKTRRGQGYSL